MENMFEKQERSAQAVVEMEMLSNLSEDRDKWIARLRKHNWTLDEFLNALLSKGHKERRHAAITRNKSVGYVRPAELD